LKYLDLQALPAKLAQRPIETEYGYSVLAPPEAEKSHSFSM